MARHAKLGPSSAHRWGYCTASVKYCDDEHLESTAGAAAEDGTRLHELTYAVLTNQIPPGTSPEDIRVVQDALDRSATLRHQFFCEYETPVQIDYRGLKTFGTTDVGGLNEDKTHLLVLDWKFGKGVRVDAEKNPAMLLYAIGFYQTILTDEEQKNLQKLTLAIMQPRLFSGPHFPQWETDRAGFFSALQELVEASWEITENRGVFRPSEHACVFCPAKKVCPHAVKNMPPFQSQYKQTAGEIKDAFQDAFASEPMPVPPSEIGTRASRVEQAAMAFDQAFAESTSPEEKSAPEKEQVPVKSEQGSVAQFFDPIPPPPPESGERPNLKLRRVREPEYG